jgi:hypothetical protein
MKQYSEIYTIRLTVQQVESLNVLRKFGVNIPCFIRGAVKEKINRDWPSIRERKKQVKMPF